MKKDKEERLFGLFGAKGTIEILEFLNEHGMTHYKDMMKYFNTYTLNGRLRELLNFGLVEHHFERTETRTEWYELTDKGRKVLNPLREIREFLKESV